MNQFVSSSAPAVRAFLDCPRNSITTGKDDATGQIVLCVLLLFWVRVAMSGFPSGMLSVTVAAFIALLALLPAAPPATGADALLPGAAMRSEIARGDAAAARCAKHVWSTENYSSCIDTLIGGATTDDAANAPFQLGVYCTAFYTMVHAYRDWMHEPANGPAVHVDGALLRETTFDQYGSCLFQAQRMKVEAHEICTMVGLSCAELNPMIDYWQTIVRTDQ